MLLLYALFSGCLAYFSWSVIRFANNYVEARRIGLPILLCPVNVSGPLWMLTKDFLMPIFTKLPLGLGEWATRADIGWTFYDRFSSHSKYGEAFTIVSPGENDIILAEPTAAEDVVRRRNDFIKNPEVYGMIEIYGPNLDTVNGKVWDRHRKITVPPFNEQNSALVWTESAEQADEMLAVWSSTDRVSSTQPDVHAVALNVLCGAGFGLHGGFVDEEFPEQEGHDKMRLGYRESLRMLLANIVQLVVLAVLRKSGVPKWLFFGSMKRLLTASDEFQAYMTEILGRERTAYEQGDVSRHNLMSALVRALEQSNEAALEGSKGSSAPPVAGLSDEEVYGNLFIYNLAGHDTTAATLHFAITLLSLYPQWQTWIAEEIDEVRKADPSGLWYYEQTFPKLKRCLALMYETLRLYGPVMMMPRYTGDAAQRLRVHDREYIIPPKTAVTLNFAALHCHPRYWGPEPLAFQPDRWIVSSEKPAGESSLFEPVPGSFIAWNSGPRVCPGKKFSQVEFVRVIFSLFANGSRVELAPNPGESEQDARARVLQIANEAKIEVTLKMVDAARIKLRWTKRS